MKNREDILILIKKCLALSKSDKPGEAAAAMNKAQELLFKYKLTMSEVDTVESRDEGTIGETPFTLGRKKNEGLWRMRLAHGVARYTFCDAIGDYESRTVYFIGTKTDVEIVKELYTWIVEQLESMSGPAWKIYSGPDRRPTFLRSFYQSATMVVSNRLYEKWNELQKETKSSTALVVQNKEALKTFIDKKYSHLRKTRSSGSNSYGGHAAGAAAGHVVNINRPSKRIGQ